MGVRTGWEIRTCPIGDPVAAGLLHAYFAELVRTYHGRPETAAEVAAAMRESPSDDLVPPTGLFLAGRYAGRWAGCLGLRLPLSGLGRLTRMFVRPEARGIGGGVALIAEAERRAAALGVHTVQLGTRADLRHARALYARSGYAEVDPLWADPYDEHFFEKRLAQNVQLG